MSDPNLVVSTNVKSARLEFLGDEEIRKLSCCRVVSPAAFAAPEGSGLGAGGSKPWGGDATGAAAAAAAAAAGLAAAVPGGVHDSRMGVFDGRETCGTCGASGSCPGHIGHIELELPALQPILMPSLVKLLKGVRQGHLMLHLPLMLLVLLLLWSLDSCPTAAIAAFALAVAAVAVRFVWSAAAFGCQGSRRDWRRRDSSFCSCCC